MQLISLCIFFSRKPTRMRRGKCIEKKKWEQISWFGSGNVVKKKKRKRSKSFGLVCFVFCFFLLNIVIYSFFFFLRNHTKTLLNCSKKLLSYKTRGITSLWMSSNQTWGTEECLANLAILWATTFPFLRTWEKEQELSCKDRARVSSMTLPNES